MANEILQTSKSRFDISNDGWRRMNAGRSPSELIREAVANAFDMDDVTEVRVSYDNGRVIIEDNSATGIKDFELITTIFMTGKAEAHTKRGRKGRGLKELIAAAESAVIETVGHTVEFNEGRVVKTNSRTIGTKVSVFAPQWTNDEIKGSFAYLLKFVPPHNIKFFVMSQEVENRHVILNFATTLETQTIDDGIQKSSYRRADVNILELAQSDDSGWIYEMGVPVQKIDTKFHIDVQQRVPLNDNRNSVDVWYLEGLFGNVLDVRIDTIPLIELKDKWVAGCLNRTNNSTKVKFVERVFGGVKGVAVKSRNTRANDFVKQHGVKVIETEGLSTTVEQTVRSVLDDADYVAKEIERTAQDIAIDSDVADPERKFTRLTRYLGLQLLSMDLNVEFMSRNESVTGIMRQADFNKDTKTIRFNVLASIKLMSAEYFGLICHEFAHAKFQEHDDHFRAEVEALSGKLAILMLSRHEDVLNLVGQKEAPVPQGMLRIRCESCAAPRDIFPHDAHQVRKCPTCTKRARTARATVRRAEKRKQSSHD